MNQVMMETKVIPKVAVSTKSKPLPEVLGTLINIVQQESGDIAGLDELTQVLNKRFNLVLETEDLIRFYTPAIFTEEISYLEQFGYERTTYSTS